MHSPGPLAGRGGAPPHRAGDPPPTDGLCSFCLPSDVRPPVGRADDSAHVRAKDGGSGEGNKVRRAPGAKPPAPLAVVVSETAGTNSAQIASWYLLV